MNKESVKDCILAVIDEYEKKGPGYMQSGTVLRETAKRLKVKKCIEDEQTILTIWHELFRTGYLAWGYDLDNLELPFFHRVRANPDY